MSNTGGDTHLSIARLTVERLKTICPSADGASIDPEKLVRIVEATIHSTNQAPRKGRNYSFVLLETFNKPIK